MALLSDITIQRQLIAGSSVVDYLSRYRLCQFLDLLFSVLYVEMGYQDIYIENIDFAIQLHFGQFCRVALDPSHCVLHCVLARY